LRKQGGSLIKGIMVRTGCSLTVFDKDVVDAIDRKGLLVRHLSGE